MGKTEKEIRDLINNINDICRDMNSLEEFEKSAKEFQNLIDSGLAKSRGYNLQTVEDSPAHMLAFNVFA